MDYSLTIERCLESYIEIEKLEKSDTGKISLERIDLSTSGEWSQCGEIFIENTQRFLLVCCLCKRKFNKMETFGEHMTSMHWPLEKTETVLLDEAANTELDSFQIEISDGEAECVESDDGMSDDVLEELQRIDECKAISSCEVVKPKQTSSKTRNDELEVKKINRSEEKNWSDVRNEEMHVEDASGYATDHASTFSTKNVPENSTFKSFDSDEGEVDSEDITSDEFTDLYKQIVKDIEADKSSSVLAAKDDHPKNFCIKCSVQCTEKSYSFHMRVQHGILSKQMKARLKRGESIPPWKCQVCGKIFQKKDGLVHHQNIHTGEKPHQCPYCPRAFASSTNLSRHIQIHLGIKNHKCSYCDKRFVSTTGRVLHERSHTQVYPFQCEECGKLFRHIHNLKDHSTVHTDITYDCPLCDKKFKRRAQLRAHKATHRRLNISCEICKREFASKRNLRIHMEIHSTEKKYVCSCGKAYSQYSKLYTHRKTNSHDVKSGNT